MSLHTGLDQIRAPEMPYFSVGGIIGRSLIITLWNFFSFLGMALVIAVPAFIIVWLVGQFTPLDGHIDIVDGRLVSPLDPTLRFLALTFVSLVVSLMIQAAVAYRAFRSLGGYHAGFGACLARSLGVLIHLGEFAIVASILIAASAWLVFSETAWLLGEGQFGIGVFFGILLLGVILFIVAGCWVVFPAIVIERIGPVAAILRSWRLTRGHRWRILVLLALFVLVEWAISYLFYIKIDLELAGPLTVVLLSVPVSFLGTVVLTASYYNLVGEKDGITALGRIFA
jgi:hypothetical protein